MNTRKPGAPRRQTINGLKELAGVLAAQAKAREAAQLWGAAALRDHIGAPLPVNEQEMYERQVEHTRAGLGESDFSAAWDTGRAMTWKQAVTYALDEEQVKKGGV